MRKNAWFSRKTNHIIFDIYNVKAKNYSLITYPQYSGRMNGYFLNYTYEKCIYFIIVAIAI